MEKHVKILGMDISGNDAALALIESSDANTYTSIDTETKKISLRDDEVAQNIKSFFGLIDGFVRDNGIDVIVIKKRNKKGGFTGGPVTFKIEALVQLLNECKVILISPVSISSLDKKHGFTIPSGLNKYQENAFRTACAYLYK